MEKRMMLQELRKIRSVAMASVDTKENPKNRIIDIMLADENAVYFCTARGKAFYQELIANPNIAITGMNTSWQMLRLQGAVEHLSNQKAWIDKIFIENPQMKQVYPNESRYILEAFKVAKGTIEWFDLGKEPIYRECLQMEDGVQILHDGFWIQENCIGCGKCQQVCPQQCIVQGNPYAIQQAHCLHCGLCYENCPAKAIQKGSMMRLKAKMSR